MARRPYGSPASLALRAAVSPAAVVVAAATVAGAIFLSPWLILPGAVLYGALVYALGPARRASRREPPLNLSALPPTIQRDVTGVRDALAQVHTAAVSAGPQQRPLFEGLLEEADALAAGVERLALSAAHLHSYLAAMNEAELTRRIKALEADIARTQDKAGRGQLEQALQASREQLAEREELAELLDRCHATMRNLEASVRGIHSSVVRLASGQIAEADAATEPLAELSEMRGTVAALEEVMQHTLH